MNILFEQLPGQDGDIGLVTLNRPKALNALTMDMFLQLDEQLKTWQHDDAIKAVVIKSNSDKAFCAGGDIRKVYEAGQTGDASINQLFWHEYRLNHRIFNYPKPYIALLHGITMGGGVGVSIHGSHRVGSETLSFSMPETGIGFFPDIGGSYFLPRFPGYIGNYLGLSGARLNIADACYVGMTTAHVAYDKFDDVLQQVIDASFSDDAKQSVTDIINQFSVPTNDSALQQRQTTIDTCFNADTVERILQNLQQQKTEWADAIYNKLLTKSPTSLKVTLEQLRRGAELDFTACMQMEYCLVNHFLNAHDFYEGIRALIVDKDNQPQWQPDNLADISNDDVAAYFAPLGDNNLLFGD